LTGRTVVITGASRGIGKAFAVSFTQAKASQICLIARSNLTETENAINAAAKAANLPVPKILKVKVDVTDVKSVEAAASIFAESFKDGLDILINNAGYLEPGAKLHESKPEEWWQSFEVNVKGTYLMTRSFLPFLQKKDGLKTITNITSVGAHMLIPTMSAYNNAKHTLIRLTEYLQAEYAEDGIIAFSLHPGGVSTELSRNLPEYLHDHFTETAELAADTGVWLTGTRKEWLKGVYASVLWDMKELEARKEEIVEKGLLKVRMVV
jgi:NAD(P)-dependent dehydrogenase (short-subunit alcohol dehydrogenase family)